MRSSLGAGRDLTITAGQDVKLAGGTVASAGNDATVSAGRDLILEAGRDERHSSSSGAGVSVGVGFGSNGVNFNVGVDASRSKAEGTIHSNAQLAAGGDVSTSSGRDTKLVGANITVDMAVGRNLEVTSLQNTARSQGRSGSLGVSFGTAGWGGSAAASKSDADRAFTDTPTSIVADGRLSIRTEDTTTITGAQIASKTGDLTLDTGRLEWRDLADHDRRSSTSVSLGTSPGAAIPGTGEFAHETQTKEGVTRATVGAGTIIIRNDPEAGLDGLNRDLAKAQEITRESGSKVRIVVAVPSDDIGERLDKIGNFFEAVTASLPESARHMGEGMERAYRLTIASGVSEQAAGRVLTDPKFQELVTGLADLEKQIALYGLDGSGPTNSMSGEMGENGQVRILVDGANSPAKMKIRRRPGRGTVCCWSAPAARPKPPRSGASRSLRWA